MADHRTQMLDDFEPQTVAKEDAQEGIDRITQMIDDFDTLRRQALRDLETYIVNNFKKLPAGSHDLKFTFVDGGLRRPVLPKQDREYVRRVLDAILCLSPKDKIYSFTAIMQGAKIVAHIMPVYDEDGSTVEECNANLVTKISMECL